MVGINIYIYIYIYIGGRRLIEEKRKKEISSYGLILEKIGGNQGFKRRFMRFCEF